MARYDDLTGKKFGRLTVVEKFSAKEVGKAGTGTYWRCKCDCGGESMVRTHDLVHAKIKSCGCYRNEVLQELRDMVARNGLEPLEKFRVYLCEKYERKCYTSPKGKCPLANDECWNHLSFRDLYNSRNGDSRRELMKHVTSALDKEGYKL